MEPNYRTICNNILRGLSPRSRDVLERRFGLGSNREKWTLELVGQDFGICRERVRQIEDDSIRQIKESSKSYYQKPLEHIQNYLHQAGGLKKEGSLIAELSSEEEKNPILFLLSLGEQFKRFGESREFYPFWTVDLDSVDIAKKAVSNFIKVLNQKQKPLSLDQYLREKNSVQSFKGVKIPARVISSYLEISKPILRTSQGLYGLSYWPEINPQRVKDRAYITFKQIQKPLHFVEVAKFLPESVHVPTLHNELIKDPRFVLVGRGIYALREWGYQPGVVKEVIADVLKKAKKPLPKSEILKEVQKQRLVKENTILLNLNNKEYFSRDPQGKYYLREA